MLEGETDMIEGLLRPQHLLIILLVAFVFFGGKKLPELGKGLGEGIKGFKESLRSATTSDSDKTVAPTEPLDKKA
jgi:sec-independent protein translocase protein TatA